MKQRLSYSARYALREEATAGVPLCALDKGQDQDVTGFAVPLVSA